MQDDIPTNPATILDIRADAERLLIPREGYHAYLTQRRNAKRRGIPFLLTLPEWWEWWQSNGWQARGRRRGCSVMARYGDVGPYALGNIYATTPEGNISDRAADDESWGQVTVPTTIRYPWG